MFDNPFEITKKVRVGIDIGSDGAYAIFVNGKLTKYGKMPKTADELDMASLVEIIRESTDDHSNIHVAFEDLHSIFGTSAKSNFSFGVNNGLVIGAMQVSKISFTKVQPKKWQKAMWEGIRPVEIPTGKKTKDGKPKYKIDAKATSLIAAKRLFPNETFLASERSKVPHDGIIDAVLIGSYCHRNY